MEELVEKAKKGNNSAFVELILSVQKDLYYIAKSRITDENDIEDVLQETMLIAFANIKKLKDKKLFKTWIIRILINNCNKSYKSKKHKFVDDKNLVDKISHQEMDISKMEFENFISFLNNDEKTILTLYYYLGYTSKEIAMILNKREGTIYSIISCAKSKIKEKYKGEFN